MIRSVDPSLPSSVLFVLWAMGHGDEVAVVDSHFIAESDENVGIQGDVVTIDDLDSLQALRAILSALQLDTTFVDYPVTRLESDRPHLLPEVQDLLDDALGFPCALRDLAYPDFYDSARNCYALIVTGGTRRLGSFILRKGLDVTPDTVCSPPWRQR
ncbi:RbsD/FucU domain-containing protein [Actinophytocola sp.]|uniref:RbsD/FucU domain-containing protein n=1 Tax=Actinophytocola sp. TaxID=1872138 RepID=UPI002ED0C50A